MRGPAGAAGCWWLALLALAVAAGAQEIPHWPGEVLGTAL